MWLKHLIKNHVFTNLVFVLVLAVGFIVYQQLPREQDPSVNFNWVQVTTIFPGAAAKDVEQKITDVLEESIELVQDIKFVSSTSREAVSSLLVRFPEMDESLFDKRVADLRREINNAESRMPEEAERPRIFVVTLANSFPTATVVLSGNADDENLRRQARAVEKDLARIKGVDKVQPTGLREPEIQVQFDLNKIQALGISPATIARSIQTFFIDVSAGNARIAQEQWLVRIQGTTADPEALAQLPILTPDGATTELRLKDVAQVVRTREKANRLVSFEESPAVLFAVMKQDGVNTLALVQRIEEYVNERNKLSKGLGVNFVLVDDQTQITKDALHIMQTNALYGLLFVLIVIWLFLGSRVSLLVTIGIPFTLAGTFIILKLLDQTLNTSVLLAIVIVLGMLVDDAVVVVESIYFKLRKGVKGIDAAWHGLLEVIKPVTASVLTTMAAFLPLMLLTGILGQFMIVIPLVVTVALAFSLVEAYWMLPGHILAAKVNFDKPSKIDIHRQKLIRRLKVKYGFGLIKVMRNPKITLASIFVMLCLAGGVIKLQLVKVDFFAADITRLFYINVEMPASSSLDETLQKVIEVERAANTTLTKDDVRSMVSYAGQMYTSMEPLYGDQKGQILVSLNPKKEGMRSVEALVEDTRKAVSNVIGPTNISFTKLLTGPPTGKSVSVKVRGDNYQELRAATNALTSFLKNDNRYKDISDDDSKGRFSLQLTLNTDAINRLGISPSDIQRSVKMLVDGEIVSYVQSEGDRIAIRLKSSAAARNQFENSDELLQLTLPSASGADIELRDLVTIETVQVKSNIRHYNFKRTITLESDIDKTAIDTVEANQLIVDHWTTINSEYPNVSLDFSGVLDDIQESVDSLGLLFMFGIGIMYIILSTQFQSYFQPFMILFTVPLAFVGVILGLLISRDPLSLYTMYGVIALAGIAVNSAIVLISTANENIKNGMRLIHATFYAARRRMLPILITTFTTIAGLFSLAAGLGGHSLVWSPVATSIVWGLVFSSTLTLFFIPVLYQLAMRRGYVNLKNS